MNANTFDIPTDIPLATLFHSPDKPKEALWKDFYDSRYALVQYYENAAHKLNIPGAKIQHGDGVVWVRNAPTSYEKELRDLSFRYNPDNGDWEKRIIG